MKRKENKNGMRKKMLVSDEDSTNVALAKTIGEEIISNEVEA